MIPESATPPTHFGRIEVVREGLKDKRIGYSPIEHRISYINNLSVPVTVEWRSGFRFSLPPEASMACNRFIIRTEIVIGPLVKNDVLRLLSGVNESSTPELRAMREAFSFQLQENKYQGATLVLDYPLTLKQLHECGGSLYFNELDTMISLLPIGEAPRHPFSEAGKHQRLVELDGTASFGYSIDVIDNHGRYGERYINIVNQIYKVTPRRDSTCRDGIYLVSNAPVNGSQEIDDRIVRHYPFANGEELGLYRSIEEAQTLGDLDGARKRELADLEHKLQIEKKNLQLVEQAHTQEMAEKNRELKALELERDKQKQTADKLAADAELERQRIKDHYENRSYQRRDTSETLKFLPTLAVGLGALFMALGPIFSRS